MKYDLGYHWPFLLLAFGVTLALSLALTPVVRRLAIRIGLMDTPADDRRVHRIPVPRLGGLAMFSAFAVGVLLTYLLPIQRIQPYEATRVALMLVGAGIITAVMAIDDIKGLPALPRLIVQVGVAFLVLVPSLIWPGGPNAGEPAGVRHFDQGAGVLAIAVQSPFGGTVSLPLLAGVLFTVIWIVGMTNTINWIDGLDGLAGGVSFIACVVLFVITAIVLDPPQLTLAYLPLVLGAAILGFLPYNFHPARIFMGDSGAMFLGFTLAVLSIIGGAKLAAALLVLGVPILDGLYMVVYRLYRGRSPLEADRGHLHHRLLDMGLSQPQVVVIFYVLCSAFGVLGLLPAGSGLVKLGAMFVMVLVLVALLIFITRRRFDPLRPAPAPKAVVKAKRPGVRTRP